MYTAIAKILEKIFFFFKILFNCWLLDIEVYLCKLEITLTVLQGNLDVEVYRIWKLCKLEITLTVHGNLFVTVNTCRLYDCVLGFKAIELIEQTYRSVKRSECTKLFMPVA